MDNRQRYYWALWLLRYFPCSSPRSHHLPIGLLRDCWLKNGYARNVVDNVYPATIYWRSMATCSLSYSPGVTVAAISPSELTTRDPLIGLLGPETPRAINDPSKATFRPEFGALRLRESEIQIFIILAQLAMNLIAHGLRGTKMPSGGIGNVSRQRYDTVVCPDATRLEKKDMIAACYEPAMT